MDAIILAGGLGTRLRSVVNEVPKCMAPVCGRPFLHYLLRYVSQFKEIDHVILSVGYLRECIFEWMKGQDLPFDVSYAIEETPLGTGGGIKLALQQVRSDQAVILNGDTLFNVDLSELAKRGRESAQAITIALKEMEHFDRYGTVSLSSDSVIERFNEKQPCEKGLINGGIYFIDLERFPLDRFPDKGSFEKEVLEASVSGRILSGYISDGYFIDIGIPSDYRKANVDFQELFD
ncbi:MAG: nucleotidyltransferase family protein [Paludibacteraceae bacterium]|nr:nucleotidyltransferase family protein [Paludibacteraceae bacterium]MBR4713315.1 nucleotidyltransferase family protein [Paludibacteraceae bacterium]